MLVKLVGGLIVVVVLAAASMGINSLVAATSPRDEVNIVRVDEGPCCRPGNECCKGNWQPCCRK